MYIFRGLNKINQVIATDTITITDTADLNLAGGDFTMGFTDTLTLIRVDDAIFSGSTDTVWLETSRSDN